ncbi:hypothetical protein KUCAC02_030800 [Chaenocephalus aceratus]|uniref:Uncharacterized protein n=1 Tax=Chaenocephalus aceratus TaxID=36190 RepID=A0ACB9XKV8_CHAAC|nr:hypothetical protein KUCAC02_030800 [Chaenocephalus aceratus]
MRTKSSLPNRLRTFKWMKPNPDLALKSAGVAI